MADLTGREIKDTYGNLIQLEGGITSSLVAASDGMGVATALSISTTEVGANGLLKLINGAHFAKLGASPDASGNYTIIMPPAEAPDSNYVLAVDSINSSVIKLKWMINYPGVTTDGANGLNIVGNVAPLNVIASTLVSVGGTGTGTTGAIQVFKSDAGQSVLINGADGTVTATGNISAATFSGNGSSITNVPVNQSNPSDMVGMVLGLDGALVGDPSVSTNGSGTITAVAFIGDGSGITGVASYPGVAADGFNGVTVVGTVQSKVISINHPVAAFTGAPVALSDVALDGSTSTGVGLQYLWTTNSGGTFDFDTSPTPTLNCSAVADGTGYTITLTVIDTNSHTDVRVATFDVASSIVSNVVVASPNPLSSNNNFSVDASGNVVAVSYTGDGTNLTGVPTSLWRNGSGAPDNSLGSNGDYYLNDDNGDVYFRSSGTYSIVANIKGGNGPAGRPSGIKYVMIANDTPPSNGEASYFTGDSTFHWSNVIDADGVDQNALFISMETWTNQTLLIRSDAASISITGVVTAPAAPYQITNASAASVFSPGDTVYLTPIISGENGDTGSAGRPAGLKYTLTINEDQEPIAGEFSFFSSGYYKFHPTDGDGNDLTTLFSSIPALVQTFEFVRVNNAPLVVTDSYTWTGTNATLPKNPRVIDYGETVYVTPIIKGIDGATGDVGIMGLNGLPFTFGGTSGGTPASGELNVNDATSPTNVNPAHVDAGGVNLDNFYGGLDGQTCFMYVTMRSDPSKYFIAMGVFSSTTGLSVNTMSKPSGMLFSDLSGSLNVFICAAVATNGTNGTNGTDGVDTGLHYTLIADDSIPASGQISFQTGDSSLHINYVDADGTDQQSAFWAPLLGTTKKFMVKVGNYLAFLSGTLNDPAAGLVVFSAGVSLGGHSSDQVYLTPLMTGISGLTATHVPYALDANNIVDSQLTIDGSGFLVLADGQKVVVPGPEGPSYIQQGTAGTFKGISLICSAAYELNWQNGQLWIQGVVKDAIEGATSIIPNSRQLIASDGTSVSIDWSQWNLLDNASHISVDWANRQLYGTDGTTVMVDYANARLGGNSWDIANTNVAIAANGIQFAGTASVIYDNTPLLSIDPNARHLIASDGATVVLDWANLKLFNSGGIPSVDFDNHVLTDGAGGDSGTAAIDWSNRQLLDATAIKSADWAVRQLYKDDGTTVVAAWGDFSGHFLADGWDIASSGGAASVTQGLRFSGGSSVLFDTSGTVSSIDPNGRKLFATDGTTVALDWSGANPSVTALTVGTGTIVETAAAQADVVIAPTASDFNALLAKLRAAGLMKT